MIVTIDRFCYSKYGIFGELVAESGDRRFECYTIERPWLHNEPYISAIPGGHYIIKRGEGYTKPGAQWRVLNVANRTGILFHVANTIDDLQGCIGLGQDLGMISGKWAVTSSRAATDAFNETLGRDLEGTLIVRRKVLQ